MNLSLLDIDGGLLLVPQFTLPADTRKGARPSFSSAASPEMGRQLFLQLLDSALETHGARTSRGLWRRHAGYPYKRWTSDFLVTGIGIRGPPLIDPKRPQRILATEDKRSQSGSRIFLMRVKPLSLCSLCPLWHIENLICPCF